LRRTQVIDRKTKYPWVEYDVDRANRVADLRRKLAIGPPADSDQFEPMGLPAAWVNLDSGVQILALVNYMGNGADARLSLSVWASDGETMLDITRQLDPVEPLDIEHGSSEPEWSRNEHHDEIVKWCEGARAAVRAWLGA
jgi:hypothetical protein